MPWPWPRCSGNCHYSTSQDQKLVHEPAGPEAPHHYAGETFCADCLEKAAGWWMKDCSLSWDNNGLPRPLTDLAAAKMTGDTHQLLEFRS